MIFLFYYRSEQSTANGNWDAKDAKDYEKFKNTILLETSKRKWQNIHGAKIEGRLFVFKNQQIYCTKTKYV
ncbi:unnamed protein product [Caenorhabditis angaria]|uniref:Uncharacterized protein n=1 Tax=Caenorhabditis angaria TaxID=860376 RepID=A0A9P1N559_9PELO|nr:unnamed protein product [Caenorhabditis angaria]